MAVPPKPWERQRDVHHRQPNYHPDLATSFIPTSPQIVPGYGGGGGMARPALPALPPRPHTSSYSSLPRPTYGGFSSLGSVYGSGMYGSGYRSFGQYGMTGPQSGMDENGFVQLAEDSSRQAFQSIESIVHAFGSVSMMLESTYHAVYSSFRAVLGVADHFSRMKSQFAQILSALAVVRTLRWLYHKLLFLIGLRSQDPSLEAAWRTITGATSLATGTQITEADIKASKSSWPIVLFLGVVFGGPYLIWRLLSTLAPSKSKDRGWVTGQSEHYAAVAQFPFQAGAKNELSFVAGQPLNLAPKDQQPSYHGWLLASNGTNSGLVPANYIKILGFHSSRPQNGDSQWKQQGNRVVATRIPSLPSSQLGPRPGAPYQGPYQTPQRGFLPQQGIPYTQQGPLPQQYRQGVPLNQQGIPLNQHGVPLNQQGVLQNQQGVPPNQQGVPLNQQGMPLNQQGMPLNQQGVPLNQQGVLQSQQGVPPNQQHVPLNQQGVPLNQQGVPLNQQGVPLNQQGVPLNQQGVPPNQQGALQNRQGAPLNQQGVPPNQQGVPPNQQSVPPNQQGVPQNQHGSPLVQQGQSMPFSQQGGPQTYASGSLGQQNAGHSSSLPPKLVDLTRGTSGATEEPGSLSDTSDDEDEDDEDEGEGKDGGF